MVQIDIPVAFAIGSMVADAAQKQLQTGKPEHYYRNLARTNVFETFFFLWIPLLFIMNFFGWETTYMWWTADSVAAYPYFVPIFVLVFYLAANGGFLLGNRLVRSGQAGLNRAIWIGVVLFSAVWILAQPSRTMRVGTYSQWAAGQAVLFYEDRVFLYTLIFVMVVWTAGVVTLYLRLRKEGQQLAA